MKVVDASVVARVLLDEAGSEAAIKVLNSKEKMVIPELLYLEIANVLATKITITKQQIKPGLDMVHEMNLSIQSVTPKLLVEAAELAKEKKTAIYDMIYAVLAKKLKCKLVTADVNFAKKTGFSWVEVV